MSTESIRIFAVVMCLGATSCVGGVADDVPTSDGGSDIDASPGEQDAGPQAQGCDRNVQIPLGADRPLDIMSADRLASVAARMPCVTDPYLRGILESADTMWYDKHSIVPGYQDSFGDNVIAPIGMRPNTIRSSLIDTAVPGGHSWIFVDRGVFHFPFGRPAGATENDAAVVDFWQLPRSGDDLLPVVWWMRQPSNLTHRIEWLFPVGTIFGEMLFIVGDDGQWYPFEIRTRTRVVDGWDVDLYRPFPSATDLADALEDKRADNGAWASSDDITALIAHLRDDETLAPAQLGATHFDGSFPTISGAEDELPGLSDPGIVRELLFEQPFRSARDRAWKSSGQLISYAPTTSSSSSIVPRGYNAGFLDVSEDTCDRCHKDAGRPFRDYYPDIIAYGELWGGDETFSWHPFETSAFVASDGSVVDFNYDNRELRDDFVGAGLLVPYDDTAHPDSLYRQIQRSWTNFAY